MGWFSRNSNEQQTQPKDEKWIVDQPTPKKEWMGAFHERIEGCPDCHGINLCEEHFVELKASTKKPDTVQDTRSGRRLW